TDVDRNRRAQLPRVGFHVAALVRTVFGGHRLDTGQKVPVGAAGDPVNGSGQFGPRVDGLEVVAFAGESGILLLHAPLILGVYLVQAGAALRENGVLTGDRDD